MNLDVETLSERTLTRSPRLSNGGRTAEYVGDCREPGIVTPIDRSTRQRSARLIGRLSPEPTAPLFATRAFTHAT